MKRKIALSIFLTAAVVFVSACSSPHEDENSVGSTVLEQMLEHRIPYIGDASEVSRLLAFLPDFDENFTQNMFSLQTQSEPFGIVIYYEPSENWNGDSMAVTDDMTMFSKHLFESIGNLGYIEFAYRLSNSNGNLEISEYQTLLHIYR